MTQLQDELRRDGQSLVWLRAGKLQPMLEARFVAEQQFFIFRPDYRRHSLGATETQPD